jgi:hypothetical protein
LNEGSLAPKSRANGSHSNEDNYTNEHLYMIGQARHLIEATTHRWIWRKKKKFQHDS